MIAATELGSPAKDEALEELKVYQQGDFVAIFRRVMQGRSRCMYQYKGRVNLRGYLMAI